MHALGRIVPRGGKPFPGEPAPLHACHWLGKRTISLTTVTCSWPNLDILAILVTIVLPGSSRGCDESAPLGLAITSLWEAANAY
jgi:hypothetical protein